MRAWQCFYLLTLISVRKCVSEKYEYKGMTDFMDHDRYGF